MIDVHPSRIIAGCMRWGAWGARFSAADYDRFIRSCLEEGVATFDHADIYGGYTTEGEFGRALHASPSLREQLRLITKCGICMVAAERPEHTLKHYDTRASHILSSVERSLVNLRTDRIDLLLIHRPDPLMVPEEVAAAVQRLRDDGKILAAGVSNFSAAQTELLHHWVGLSAHQLELSLVRPEALYNGVLDRCRMDGIALQAWSPLGGLWTVPSASGDGREGLRAAIQAVADRRGMSAEQVLIAWVLHHPYRIHPVIGTTQVKRMRAAVAAEGLVLSRQEWFGLLEASRGREVD